MLINSDTTAASAADVAGNAFSLQGNFTDIAFPMLLKKLKEEIATGALTCKTGQVLKTLYIRKGQPVYALSTAEEDSLATILLKSERISESQFMEIKKLMI